jgi:hypothetical protein
MRSVISSTHDIDEMNVKRAKKKIETQSEKKRKKDEEKKRQV